jgi:elongation factor 1-beta
VSIKDLKMGMSAVQFKIMPENPDIDLKEVGEKVKKVLEEMGGVFNEVKEEPIAFGLKALVFSFAYPEEKEIDEIGNKFNELEGVSSAEMTDYRRALG